MVDTQTMKMSTRLTAILVLCALSGSVRTAEDVYPSAEWEHKKPSDVGMSAAKLDELAKFVGGRGCVVRHGYLVYTWGDPAKSGDIASAVKPVISTLMLMAIEEGKLKSVDDRLANVEPRLKSLNNGKDAKITWRHLASQTSGYGLTEQPGEAYSYNDYALALYYDTLMNQVYRRDGTEVLTKQLADPLGFQDRYSFQAFGPMDRPGRLAISCRDFARFGLLYLRNGKWKDRQLVPRKRIEQAISSPIPADTPLTRGKDAAMLPNQRSLGGGKNITPVGPGFYSFNWWINGTDKKGRRLFPTAPNDLYVASGHGGRRALWIVPSLDLIVTWNDTNIQDHDQSPGNPKSRCNQAVTLFIEAVKKDND